MKLTEEQIWKCNNTINYENGEVVDGVHICLKHQNVVDFARAIEREIGFDRAEIWIKRINEAVLAEREACAKVCDEASDKALSLQGGRQDDLGSIILRHHAVAHQSDAAAIRAKGGKL
jgi:hypothetical protein